MKEQELFEIKRQIEENKQEISSLLGSEKTLIEQLRDVWGVSSVEDALTKLEREKKKVSKMTEQINEALEEIETLYLNIE